MIILNIFKIKNIVAFIIIFSLAIPFPDLNPMYETPEAEAGFRKVVFLTIMTESWVVPEDWNNAANTIEVIGGGGGGADSATNVGSGGGGGGGYSRSVNLRLTPGDTLDVNVDFGVGASGSGGQATAVLGKGGNTWFMVGGSFDACASDNTVCVKAEGGEGGKPSAVYTGGAGGNFGLTASAVGTTRYAGGSGGTGSGGDGDGGGGGSAGPYGNGKNGGNSTGTNGGGGGGGGGGGDYGNGGATVGTANSGTGGVTGGNGYLGRGAGAAGAAGGIPSGGGGGGAAGAVGGAGAIGQEWDLTHGSGGGSGGTGDLNGAGTNPGLAGKYGAGSGGGGGCTAALCRGADGIIVITYVPAGHVVRGNVKIRGIVKFR